MNTLNLHVTKEVKDLSITCEVTLILWSTHHLDPEFWGELINLSKVLCIYVAIQTMNIQYRETSFQFHHSNNALKGIRKVPVEYFNTKTCLWLLLIRTRLGFGPKNLAQSWPNVWVTSEVLCMHMLDGHVP
jgi:hypothetical protein